MHNQVWGMTHKFHEYALFGKAPASDVEVFMCDTGALGRKINDIEFARAVQVEAEAQGWHSIRIIEI